MDKEIIRTDKEITKTEEKNTSAQKYLLTYLSHETRK